MNGRMALGYGRIDSPRCEFIQDGFGVVAHELGHGVGLPHDMRNIDADNYLFKFEALDDKALRGLVFFDRVRGIVVGSSPLTGKHQKINIALPLQTELKADKVKVTGHVIDQGGNIRTNEIEGSGMATGFTLMFNRSFPDKISWDIPPKPLCKAKP